MQTVPFLEESFHFFLGFSHGCDERFRDGVFEADAAENGFVIGGAGYLKERQTIFFRIVEIIAQFGDDADFCLEKRQMSGRVYLHELPCDDVISAVLLSDDCHNVLVGHHHIAGVVTRFAKRFLRFYRGNDFQSFNRREIISMTILLKKSLG